jgi:hypothetical protein
MFICLLFLVLVMGGSPTGAQNTPMLLWPVAPPTADQITDAEECALYCTMIERYPDTLTADELEEAYQPKTACDWAVLASAYAARQNPETLLPAEARTAFYQTIRANPAFAFRIRLFYGYFDTNPLVEAPPFAGQPVTQVVIRYTFWAVGGHRSGNNPGTLSTGWNRSAQFVDDTNCGPGGGGYAGGGESGDGGEVYAPIDYEITITQAETDDALASGIVQKPDGLFRYAVRVDPALVQALGPALTDFLPIGRRFEWDNCGPEFTDWVVTLTFADGTTLTMQTIRSDFILSGGPWQLEFEGQAYMQYSSAFLSALIEIVTALDLPVGRAAGLSCGSSSEIMDMVYPPFERFR